MPESIAVVGLGAMGAGAARKLKKLLADQMRDAATRREMLAKNF